MTNIINKNVYVYHEKLREGERFFKTIHKNEEIKVLKIIENPDGLKTLRIGIKAFNDNGDIMSNYRPLFIQESEYREVFLNPFCEYFKKGTRIFTDDENYKNVKADSLNELFENL